MSKVDVYSLLRKRYPAEEYVLLKEVSDATGSRNRSLDYMVVNLWPSRGLSIIGIEQKSHRSDWLNELKNPKKQELHYKYCDYFYLLTTAEKVAYINEIPETWGWMHIKDGSIRIIKQAPKNDAESIPRSLLCSMLRRAADKTGYVYETLVDEKVLERVKDKELQFENKYKYLNQQYDELREIIREFEKYSGIDIMGRYSYNQKLKDIGQIIRMFMASSPENLNTNLSHYIKRLHEHMNTLTNMQEYLQNQSTGILPKDISTPENT